jgi:hypothetical protein
MYFLFYRTNYKYKRSYVTLNILKVYLEKLQKNESIFPMDSPATGRKIYRTVYPESESRKETLLIDFDGTIHGYSKGWLDGKIYDPPILGAKEAIDKLKEKYRIVIFTTRASRTQNGDNVENQLQMLKDWLSKYDIYYDSITAEKIGAVAIIDDIAIPFKKDWQNVLTVLEQK